MILSENPIIIIYFIMYIFLIIGSLIATLTKNKGLDTYIVFSSALLVVCILGFRQKYIIDLEMYLGFFRDFEPDFSKFYWGSYGFYLLYKTIYYISKSDQFFVFFTSLFFVALELKFVYLVEKNSFRKSLLFLTVFSSFYMLDLSANGYRQAISVLFIAFSTCYFFKKKYLKHSLSFVLALSFHWAAIIPIILFYISILFSKKIIFLKLFSIFIFLIFTISIFYDINIFKYIQQNANLFNNFGQYIGVNLEEKINAYINLKIIDGAMFYHFNFQTKIRFIFEIYFALIINLIFFFTKKQNYLKNYCKIYLYYYSYFLCLTFYSLALISMMWFFRNFYWMPIISILTIFFILKQLENNKYYSFYMFIFYMFLIFYSLIFNWTYTLLINAY